MQWAADVQSTAPFHTNFSSSEWIRLVASGDVSYIAISFVTAKGDGSEIMLPDFPNLKRKIVTALLRYLDALVRRNPLMSQIRQVSLLEGDRAVIRRQNGSIEECQFRETKGESSIRNADIIAMGPYAFLESHRTAASQIQSQQAELVLNRMSKAAESVGNVVDAGGKPFSFEVFMEALEKVWIDFDKDGKPKLPSFHFGPALAKGIERMQQERQRNPEYERAFGELMKRKKEEFDACESNRKLVD